MPERRFRASERPLGHIRGSIRHKESAVAAPRPRPLIRRQCPTISAGACRVSARRRRNACSSRKRRAGLEDEIVRLLRKLRSRKARLYRVIIRGADSAAQPVAIGAEREDSLDRVPPVGQPASHMKREVELGRRDLARVAVKARRWPKSGPMPASPSRARRSCPRP